MTNSKNMKEKLSNGCINIAITVIPFAMLWGAISMFKYGEYIKGSICVLGTLLRAKHTHYRGHHLSRS